MKRFFIYLMTFMSVLSFFVTSIRVIAEEEPNYEQIFGPDERVNVTDATKFFIPLSLR